MRIVGIAASVAICAGALFVPDALSAATYTWEPTDGKWDTTTGNWNDGTASGIAWVDDAANPNNAVFGSSASKKKRLHRIDEIRQRLDGRFELLIQWF